MKFLLLGAACAFSVSITHSAENCIVAPPGPEVHAINTALAAGNCANALTWMKAGVKTRHPQVLLLAGTMFENGFCVKPDWDKAVTMYQLAGQAGNTLAIPRLM